MEPRRDADWLRRKFQDYDRRVDALENGRRLDASTDGGLGRPWISPGPVWITGSAFWATTTSATYTRLAYTRGVIQHPYHLVLFQWRITDGATSGSYQLVQTVNGNPTAKAIGSFAGPNPGGSDFTFVAATPGTFPSLLTIEVQGLRTAGTGTVDAHIDAVIGCGLEDNPYPLLP